MKIIEPSVELWNQGNDWEAHVAKCARVCYGSNKTTQNEELVNALIKSSHNSMFRHRTAYFIGRYDDVTNTIIQAYHGYIGFDYCRSGLDTYIVVNGNWLLDHCEDYNLLKPYEVDELQFANTKIGFNMMRYTFKIVTQISTSRELNRVSPNNIAEQSTRYVYENGTLCCPHWISIEDANKINNGGYTNHKIKMYIDTCKNNFNNYKELIDVYGLHRQDARGILPLDTATICIYTYSIKEWRHIIDLRYYGTTGKPHPNCVIIAKAIKEKLEELGYEFRE